MSTALLSIPIFRAFDSAGNPLAGGLLYTYIANTTTPATTWSDFAGSTPNANPVVLDSTGSATVRTDPSVVYKFVLKDSGGATQWTEDYYSPGGAVWLQTATELAAGVTPVSFAYPPGDIRRYGGVGDGATDNTTAINNAYACLNSGGIQPFGTLYFPAGNYKYLTALTFAGQKRPAVYGDGPVQSRLTYGGANTTNDCVTIGDGTHAESGWDIRNIGFYSSTVMTGGAGMHLQGFNRSHISNVHWSDQDTNGNFYIGAWFDGVDFSVVNAFQARGSLEGLRVNGQSTLGLADLYLNDGKIGRCATGVHVGGSFGGLVFGAMGIINNGTNVLIDNAITGVNNREITFSSSCALDSACIPLDAATFNGINLDIQDTNGSIFWKSAWNASAGTLIRIGASFAGTLLLEGGYLFNAFTAYGGNGHAIDINSASTVLYVDGTYFRNITAAGITPSVATTNVILHNPRFNSDVVNPIGANVGTNTLVTYITSSQAILGNMAVGDNSTHASATNSSPTFGISGGAAALQAWSNTVGNAWFVLGHSRGTTPGTHTTLNSGDQLGGIAFEGSDGTAFRIGALIMSNATGAPSGSQIPANLLFKVNPGTGVTIAKTISALGDLVNVAGATNMTSGFICIPSAAGVPSGAPAVASGNVPLYWDATNLQLYVYTGGAWKKSAVFT